MATAPADRDPPGDGCRISPGPVVAAPARVAGLPRRQEASREIAIRHGPRLLLWRAATARRRRLSLGWLSFGFMVALPMIAAATYYFFVAADQYVAELRFALRSAEPMPVQFAGMLPTDVAPSPVAADSYIIVEYILSRAVVDDLGRTIELRKTFSTRRADWPARLHLPVSVEELVEYWKGQVDAFFDAANGTIVVRARAFTPEDALRLSQGILAASERLVNRLSARARQSALSDAKAEVERAELRLSAALGRLREFRDREGLIDPNKAADSSRALADRVRDALVRANTELSTLKQYMRNDAPPVKLLEARIAALEDQRRSVENEITATTKTHAQALSRIMGRYEELDSERHFAESAYQHALQALDRSRLNADRQQVYIADFVPPRLPEDALYPRRVRALAIVFLVSFALWAIGSLTVRSIRDHL
jgi:capsular polysaccharide transport system permease protein